MLNSSGNEKNAFRWYEDSITIGLGLLVGRSQEADPALLTEQSDGGPSLVSVLLDGNQIQISGIPPLYATLSATGNDGNTGTLLFERGQSIAGTIPDPQSITEAPVHVQHGARWPGQCLAATRR